MYIERHIENQIKDASKYYPVVMVCGQRQVGKSTMLDHIKEENRRYVTMDDGNARRLASTDPALFFETYGYPLLIDEFQREPNILLEMKKIIDQKNLEGEDTNGMFWLTGSKKFKMMKDVSESLAGRVAVFDMSGLSMREIDNSAPWIFDPSLDSIKQRCMDYKKKNVHQIYEHIFRGSMPKLNVTDLDRDRFYMDYINTYIERDIKELSLVGKLNKFYDFLVYMAARTGQELKYNDISATIGISAPTAKEWVTILERSGVIYILKPYYSNITKRLIKTPKMYFMDTGLAAYLCRWPSAETLEMGAMDGAFFETFVVSEIVKSFYNAGKPVDLYYYRDIDGKEIDLLMVKGDKMYPIEIKKGKEPTEPDKNFSVLKKFNMEVKPGIILCMADDLIPYNRESWYVPVAAL